jgi:hypothetical protein
MKTFCMNHLTSLSLVSGAVLLSLVLGASPSLAYEQDAQSACTSDVMRLCQAFIPDHGRIAACLSHHRRELSPACRSVVKNSKKKTHQASR